MMREWLPHLFVAIFALLFAASGATFLAMNDSDQVAVEEKWSDWLSPPHDENATSYQVARLPSTPFMVWGTMGFAVVGGFYLAAAMAGFVHRTET